MAGRRNKLSRLELLFIECYLDCFDVGEAAQRSGCIARGDTDTAIRKNYQRIGRKIMRRQLVGVEIEKRLSGSVRSYGVEKGKVLKSIADVAYFDPANLFAEDGSPLPLSQIDPATRSCITSIKLQEVYEGAGAQRQFVGYIREYKILNSLEARKLLGSHLRLFEEDVKREKDRLDEIVNALRTVGEPPRLLEGEGKIIDG